MFVKHIQCRRRLVICIQHLIIAKVSNDINPLRMKHPMCTVVSVPNVDHLFSGTQKINHTSPSLQVH